jgi:glycosyltransferase involved in cell wall biosynthesis
MRILVCPAMMEIGGSQSNAVELAGAVRGHGHEVIVFGPRGKLVDTVKDLGLEFVPAPHEGSWPSRRNVAVLSELVRARGIDLVHAYEWGPAADVAFGPHLRLGTPMLTTVLSMDVPTFVPRHAPLIVGTRALAYAQQRVIRSRVYLMEPPIDTDRNTGTNAVAPRRRFGFGPGDVVVAVVGRLVDDLGKLAGVLDAIAVVDDLAVDRPVRMLVVGEGTGLDEVREAALAVQERHGRPVVLAPGSMLDPRDAYDAADIVLGMGSSALKGMAFGKPLIVQGADGFWKLLDDDSLPLFLNQGWYGVGGGGRPEFAAILSDIVDDRAKRQRLGSFGRRVVLERFSLARASSDLASIYDDVSTRPTPAVVKVRGLTRLGVELAKFKTVMARQGRATRSTGRSGRALSEATR